MTSFVSTQLFGGAISADLPSGFGDASDIREVPDHQEVYVDSTGLTSIIFDITERVTREQGLTDEDALKFHFSDIADDPTETTKFWHGGSAEISKMPGIPTYILFATQHPAEDIRSRKPQPDFTGILLVLIRLEKQKTDIVISVNVPHVPGEYQKDEIDLPGQKIGSHLEAARDYRQRILETFEVKDWTLFVNEE